ncbi:MAG: Nif3-like dinuclear metal center hexameric protein [Thiotrichales bacterium]
MVELQTLVEFLDETLQVSRFSDACPNGLQVEGRGRIERIVSGVTASAALLDAAVAARADAVLVHHGYFWRGERAVITGIRRRRLKTLLEYDISLIAYHLPLDAHAVFGNNAQLARVLDLEVVGPLNPEGIGNHGRIRAPVGASTLAAKIERALGRKPLVIAGGEHSIATVAWCTGAAQGYIEQAANLGIDAFISGEISEHTVHFAREAGIHYFAAGHHATERYGVQALGAHVADRFGVEHRFIDIDNPV